MSLGKEFEGYRSTVQGLIESSGNKRNLVTTVLALIPGAGVYSILRLTHQSPETIIKQSLKKPI